MPPSPQDRPSEPTDYVLKVERAPLYIWLARLTWAIIVLVLLEFDITSWQEREPHAAILATALLTVLVLAGIIVEVVRHVEARSPYRQSAPLPDDEPVAEIVEPFAVEPDLSYSPHAHSHIEDAS
ncbi:MAG TPA: hypothetical protein PKD09_12130 [Aggregatilinea sp.]|uniref:hypothetical protein n=1 Tax=Aggregatilinea sp. TaxID=2806333 RepID=UPI002CD6DFDD|nr:hypothetical protein [Aggregatilinea sp.]HML22391.1 hypothetical protein [Aggregatilinea sp.]